MSCLEKPPPKTSQKGLDNPSPTTSRMLPPFQTQSSHTRRAAVGRGAHLKRKQLYNQRQTIPQPFGNRDSGQKSLQMIYAALVALPSILCFDSPLCLPSRGRHGKRISLLCIDINTKSFSVAVVCILGESVFRLGDQGDMLWGLVRVPWLVGRSELGRLGMDLWSRQMSVTFPPSKNPWILRCCGLRLPFSWVQLEEKQEFFSFPLGGARLSGIVVGEAALLSSKGAAPSPSPAQGF